MHCLEGKIKQFEGLIHAEVFTLWKVGAYKEGHLGMAMTIASTTTTAMTTPTPPPTTKITTTIWIERTCCKGNSLLLHIK